MTETTQTEHAREQVATVELAESERYRLLADEQRQVVLAVLAERTAPLALPELVTEVKERETTGMGVESDAREKIRIALHHMHLPMMDDMGVVDYDPETQRIEPRELDSDRFNA